MKKVIFILAISFLAFSTSCHANERIEELEKENRRIDQGILKAQKNIQFITQRKIENFGAIRELKRIEAEEKDDINRTVHGFLKSKSISNEEKADKEKNVVEAKDPVKEVQQVVEKQAD